MADPQPIRIAITGGGIAGATLLHALLPHSHLDVHIFEAAPAFREGGLGIGLSRNAMQAMELMGAAGCVERAGAFLLTGLTISMAVGKEQGQVIGKVGHQNRGFLRSVGRAALLHELLAGVPAERMHASKRLEKVVHKDDSSLELHFHDGSTHSYDILIGADGIRGVVRNIVLGDSDPAAAPYNGGWWSLNLLNPYEKAAPLLQIKDQGQHVWIGNNAFLIYSILAEGTVVVSALASRDEHAGDQYKCSVPAEVVRKLYQDWPPHLVRAIEELYLVKPEVDGLYPWEHSVPARTYTSGPISLIGDAAHATTPWLGSGGGMSIEDCLILSTLLGRVKTVSEATTALKVYDEMRRPRTQRVVDASREAGYMMTGLGKDTGLDPERLREKLPSCWDFIHNFDLEKHRDEALKKLEHELKRDMIRSVLARMDLGPLLKG